MAQADVGAASASGSSSKRLAGLKKTIQKANLKLLLEGDIIQNSLGILSQSHSDDLTLDILSVHLALYRQLRFIFESPPSPSSQVITDLVHSQLAPLFQPTQACGKIFLLCLSSSIRTKTLRATEALGAAGRMVDVLPPPSSSSSSASNMLVPLFQHACTPRVLGKLEMTLINVLLPHVPDSIVPDDLLDKLKVDFDSLDSANLRCNIISNLLLLQSEDVEDDDERDRAILQPLLPLFDEDSQPPGALLNLTRYLLPSLFTAQPSLSASLLAALARDATGSTFSGWVSVAALGVSSGSMDITELPQQDLLDAIAHADSDIRLRAFQLLAGCKDLLRDAVVDLIKQSLSYNAILPSAGGRSEFSSAVHAFLKRLKDTTETIIRTHGANDTRLDLACRFRSWLVTDFIDPGLAVACRYPVVKAILALSVLKLYLDIYGSEHGVQATVYTRQRVDSLFTCQASEFTEVRGRARAILERAEVALPGYETFESPATKLLVDSCLASIDHPRNTQAEAGKSALCIVFQKLLLDNTSSAIPFVDGLIERMEKHVRASEVDLVKGLEQMPLHGIVAAVRDIISCIKLRDAAGQLAWKSTFHRLVLLVDRIWTVTSSVISLAPNKAANTERADHEIARAYEVMGGGDEEDEDEAMDHTNLLSGCWRATKGAGELLSTLVILPVRQGGSSEVMWNTEQVDEAGKRFLLWMHEIRHRGTFSKIASAFTDLVDAVKTVDSLKPLCYSWLQNELNIITTDSLSTTRRSAALPYSVLAIVAADVKLLDVAFEALNELARVDNTASSDITKVHAFNILKIVLLDAKQAKLLDRYFERAVMTALHAFASPNWNVRNVGLILFSTIVHRTLAPGRGTQDFFASKSNLSTRQTLAHWHNKYPSVIPYITQILSDLSASTTPNAHSPLFPILIIIRSLRWSADGVDLAGRLIPVVQKLLGSKEWQVRMVSAQALSSLVSPEQAVVMLQEDLGNIITQTNAHHGHLLLKRHLIAEVVDWSLVDRDIRTRVEHRLSSLLDSTNVIGSPLVVKATLDLIASYLDVSVNISSMISDTQDLARQVLSRREALPGQNLLVESATAILFKYGQAGRPAMLACLKSPSEDLQIAALDRLMATRGKTIDGKSLELLMDIASGQSALSVKISALEALLLILDIDALAISIDLNRKTAFTQVVLEMAKDAKSVPLREAALAVSGWAVALCAGTKPAPDHSAEMFETVLALTTTASEVEQSQPCRYSALQAIKSLGRWLFPSAGTAVIAKITLVGYHRLLLRLLQDDDESNRLECSDMISRGLKVSRAVCQRRALELEWEYIGQCAKEESLDSEWYTLMREAILDKAAFESDLTRLEQQPGKGEALFLVEAPNLFRDSLVDLRLATAAIIKYTLPMDPSRQDLERQMTLAQRVVRSEEPSPIVAKYDLVRKMKDRLTIWESLPSAPTVLA